MKYCLIDGCLRDPVLAGICQFHMTQHAGEKLSNANTESSMAAKYPKYYKAIPKGITELDIYAVCQLFDVNDAALSHALKKIMLPGTRTGGKSQYEDIKEARDTLNRWLELNEA